jgi:hypothetical protein
MMNEIQHRAADPEIEEKQGKLERKVKMKYKKKGRNSG